MKVLVVGAGGIIGQHLMISVPAYGIEPTFTRLHGGSPLYEQFDVCGDNWEECLDKWSPDVVVNLAGDNSVDSVEREPEVAHRVNVRGVVNLLDWCDKNAKHLIHVSSQAAIDPVNEYGKQKRTAEDLVQRTGDLWTIIRPTFVLGIRPFPGIGRENPAERILSGKEQESVYDRFFSVSFAWDVAKFIWDMAAITPAKRVLQVGNPEKMSRLSVAHKLGVYPKRVKHDTLLIAQRPGDTTYTENSWYQTSLNEGMSRLEAEYGQRDLDSASYRAKEIGAYFKMPWEGALEKLQSGFIPLHHAVAEDFRKVPTDTEEELLAWYRGTDAYIWELTAYHLDPGFNYRGMVKGIAESLKSKDVKSVLCLGDGVGTLTIALRNAGIEDPHYNDLWNSRTQQFAFSRFFMRGTVPGSVYCTPRYVCSLGWEPFPDCTRPFFDAVVSLDFLEHVTDVEAWVRKVYELLKPGGYFVAQNGFNMGSGKDGSIPMHLSVNDRFEKDWDPLLFSLGFVQLASNWYQKP